MTFDIHIKMSLYQLILNCLFFNKILYNLIQYSLINIRIKINFNIVHPLVGIYI